MAHVTVITESVCWEFPKDHFPWRCFTDSPLGISDTSKETSAASTVAFAAVWSGMLILARLSRKMSSVSALLEVSSGASRGTMTLFLGYFLLLLPKWIFPLVEDVTSPPLSPLLSVTLEAWRWCQFEPKFNPSPKIHLLAFSRIRWCFLIGKDATEIGTVLEILPLISCIPTGNNKYTV